MKIKFSKVLAIVCALCVAFAGLTAFAAPSVTTRTNYDHDAVAGTKILVETTVAGLSDGTEVTYYVASDASSTSIVYINQKSASEGTVDFTFEADKDAVLAANAKFGSNSLSATFPTFYFNEGSNYFDEADANAAKIDAAWGVAYEGGYSFKADLDGNAKEYGIVYDGNYYPAAGCDEDGVYMVVLKGLGTINAADVDTYVK